MLNYTNSHFNELLVTTKLLKKMKKISNNTTLNLIILYIVFFASIAISTSFVQIGILYEMFFPIQLHFISFEFINCKKLKHGHVLDMHANSQLFASKTFLSRNLK